LAIYYRIDGATPQLYTAPFDVLTEGTHVLSFWSVDAAGNIEAAQSLPLKIDGTPPTLAWGAITPAPNPEGWNNTAVDIPYTVRDEISGVTQPGVQGSIHLSAEGKDQTQTVTVVDAAGNSRTFSSPPISIDRTTPITTTAVDAPAGSRGWQIGAASVTLTAVEALSGVRVTYYQVDGGAIKTYSAPFTVTGEGLHHVLFWSEDRAGNREATQTQILRIDSTPPVITAKANPAVLWPPTGELTAVVISGKITDATAGVDADSMTYTVVDSEGKVQPYGPVILQGDGTYSFTVQLEAKRSAQAGSDRLYTVSVNAKDLAGNAASTTTRVTVPHAKPTASEVSLSSVTASSARGVVQLNFTGALDAAVASDASHYGVLINGFSVPVQNASYQPGNNAVTLRLASGALRQGDTIIVSWQGLRDVNGNTLSGETLPLIAR
jgi:hypothetical protein